MKNYISLLFLLTIFSACSPPVNNFKVGSADYFGEGRGGQPHGFGILQYGQTILLGKFNHGKKHGWFKVIDKDGSVGLKYYKKGRLSKTDKGLYINSEMIASGEQISIRSSTKLFGHSLKNDELFFGRFSDQRPFRGVYKTSFGMTQVGYLPNVTNVGGHAHYILPTAARLYGGNREGGDFHVSHYVSHTGQRIDSAYEEKYETLPWGDVKAWVPSTNTLAPEILVINFKNGDFYVGEGQGLKAQGYGHIKRKDGMEIWGWFENNKLNGDAIEKRVDGKMFAGTYKGGLRHGIFFQYGVVPQYKFKKVIDLASYQKAEEQFLKLENWFTENQGKEGRFSKPPFSEDFEFDLDPHKIISYKIEYDKSKARPWQLRVRNNHLLGQLPGDYDEKYFIALESGLVTPGSVGALTNLPSKGNRIVGKVYRNGSIVNSFASKQLSRCPVSFDLFRTLKTKGSRATSFYGEGCSGKKSFSSKVLVDDILGTIIFNAKVVNGKLVSGESHLYDYGRKKGFIGKKVAGKYQGKVRFINEWRSDIYREYVNGKVVGRTYSPGRLKINHENRKGSFYLNGALYTGQFNDEVKTGKFSFKNFYNNTTGSLSYDSLGKKNGQYIEKEANGSVFVKYTYQKGVRVGKGLCRYQKKTEPCEFKNNKRVDITYKKHMQREAYERAKAKKFLKDFYARQKIRKEKRQREEAEYKAKVERRKRIQARIKRVAREHENRQFRQQYQQILKNQRNYSNFYNNYTNYGNTKTVPAVAPKPAPGSSSGGVKLTSKTGYKQCELTKSYDGKRFATFYNCNDQEGTLPKARKELQEKISHYAYTIRLQKERQAKASREDQQYQNKLNDKCAQHLRKGGDVCDKICANTSHAKGSKCRTGSF